jgi:hypothetical protein
MVSGALSSLLPCASARPLDKMRHKATLADRKRFWRRLSGFSRVVRPGALVAVFIVPPFSGMWRLLGM